MNTTIEVRLSYYGNDGSLHTNIGKPMAIDSIKNFENFDKIDLKTSRGISVLQHKNRNIVFQSGGYSYQRGLYVDMFEVNIWQIYG